MKKILTLLILLTSTFTFNASAAIFTKCDNCTSDYQLENIATYIAESEGGSNNVVFVANSKSNTLKKYRIINIRSFESGVPNSTEVVDIELSSSEKAIATELNKTSNEIIDFFNHDNNVPVGVADTIYDLVADTAVSSDVANHYINNQSIRQKVGNYTSLVLSVAGKVVNVNFVIELDFSDNSIGVFKLDGIDKNGNITLKLISGTDADNNNVNLTKKSFVDSSGMTSNYRFTNQGAEGINNFLAAAARLGISTSSGGGSFGGSLSMTCSEKAGGLTCVLDPH